jgi:hypothetical protein
MSDAELNSIGTSFLDITNPLKPVGDLLTDIAELLREGLPSALGSTILKQGVVGRSSKIRALGGEYLNYVFGITPLVSSFSKFFNTIFVVDQTIDQWLRDNRLLVRRRRRVLRDPVKLSNQRAGISQSTAWRSYKDNGNVVSLASVGDNPGSGILGFHESYTSTTTEIFFSAGFRYDLSLLSLGVFSDFKSGEMGGLSDAQMRAYLGAHAFGVSPSDPSLSTVWNLIPFSWLLDWFVNIGDALDVLRGQQTAGLRSVWAYVSAYETRKVSILSGRKQANNGASFVATASFTQKSVNRRRATPFGFYSNFGTLSASQLAILGALASQAL